MVKSTGGDAGGLTDVPDRHLVKTPLPHEFQGGVQDLPLRLLALKFSALGILHVCASFLPVDKGNGIAYNTR